MQAPTPVLEAIALQKCLMATYNKLSIKLAPHILYTRHGEMFIDAVTMEREGQAPRELKLGVFKLAGLTDLRTVDEHFDQMGGLYDPDDGKYKGVTLFAIDPQTASV